MKTFNQFLESRGFSNWRVPSRKELEHEYKIEYEIKSLKSILNNVWPTLDDFLEAAGRGKVMDLSENEDRRIEYRSHTRSHEQLLDLIRGYASYPKFRNEQTVQDIFDGFERNDSMPMPIVLRMPHGGLRIMGGNTRLDVAFMQGVRAKVFVIDARPRVEEHTEKTFTDFLSEGVEAQPLMSVEGTRPPHLFVSKTMLADGSEYRFQFFKTQDPQFHMARIAYFKAGMPHENTIRKAGHLRVLMSTFAKFLSDIMTNGVRFSAIKNIVFEIEPSGKAVRMTNIIRKELKRYTLLRRFANLQVIGSEYSQFQYIMMKPGSDHIDIGWKYLSELKSQKTIRQRVFDVSKSFDMHGTKIVFDAKDITEPVNKLESVDVNGDVDLEEIESERERLDTELRVARQRWNETSNMIEAVTIKYGGFFAFDHEAKIDGKFAVDIALFALLDGQEIEGTNEAKVMSRRIAEISDLKMHDLIIMRRFFEVMYLRADFYDSVPLDKSQFFDASYQEYKRRVEELSEDGTPFEVNNVIQTLSGLLNAFAEYRKDENFYENAKRRKDTFDNENKKRGIHEKATKDYGVDLTDMYGEDSNFERFNPETDRFAFGADQPPYAKDLIKKIMDEQGFHGSYRAMAKDMSEAFLNIRSYTGSQYSGYNNGLREEDDEWMEYEYAAYDRMVSVFEEAPRTKAGIWVYRNCNIPDFEPTIGEDIVDHAFLSTSIDPQSSFNSSANLRLAIFVPKGSMAFFAFDSYSENSTEKEVILPPFSVIRPIEIFEQIDTWDTKMHIKCIYVGNGARSYINQRYAAEGGKIERETQMKFTEFSESRKRQKKPSSKFDEPLMNGEKMKAAQQRIKDGKVKIVKPEEDEK